MALLRAIFGPGPEGPEPPRSPGVGGLLLVAFGGLAACGGPGESDASPAGPARIELDGTSLDLAGLQQPELAAPLRAAADELVASGDWAWTSPGPAEGPPRLMDGPRDLGLELVEAGLALGHQAQLELPAGPNSPVDGLSGPLTAAAAAAQAAGRGLFAPEHAPAPRPLEQPLAGICLPMHHKDFSVDYAWELAEVAELGARWVNLIVVTQQQRNDSSEVPLRTLRTPPDERIRATIRAARALGLRVQLMPVVLIAEPGPEDWRGTLAPADRAAWWRSYDRFVCHLADLAREGGADVICIGSELATMEADEGRWRQLVRNVRMRYAGSLTYSANWDHFAELPFWDALDLASMTGYFEVCQETTFGGSGDRFPDVDACLRAGWRAGLSELRHLAAVSGLPTVYSEVGIPSVEGALAKPWDYTLDGPADPDGQRRAFEAFASVFLPGGTPASGYGGAFLYDYWGEGGPADKTYTPRGKPAADVWRRILAESRAAAGL